MSAILAKLQISSKQLWLGRPQQRFMRWGLLLSITLHIGVLAWQQDAIKKPDTNPPLLEMVLVNASTESSPVTPTAFAQANLDGGGEVSGGFASSTQPKLGTEAQNIVIDAMTKRRLQLEAEQRDLLTLLESTARTPQAKSAESFIKNLSTSGNDQTDQAELQLNAKLAVLSEQVREYNARPRKHFDAPSTRAHKFATYVDQWRSGIEKTGTKFYPGNSNQRVYGTLQASITINASGQVIDITIDKPSNQAVLNQSVKRIVSLAGPFAPFTPEMRKEIDQIVITRTWHFLNTGTLKTEQ